MQMQKIKKCNGFLSCCFLIINKNANTITPMFSFSVDFNVVIINLMMMGYYCLRLLYSFIIVIETKNRNYHNQDIAV